MTELALAICLGMCAQAVIRLIGRAIFKAGIYIALKRSPRFVEFMRRDSIETAHLRTISGLDK